MLNMRKMRKRKHLQFYKPVEGVFLASLKNRIIVCVYREDF